MQELTQLRYENAKTFDLGNGQRHLESHIGAIHYRDNYADLAEAWKDIDLTWVNNQILTAPYELTRNGQQYIFKDKKTGEISTIERTSVFPPGIPFEIVPEFSAVRFRHTLPSANIPFEAQFAITGNLPITRAFDDGGELELETTFVGGVLTEKLTQVKDKQTGKVRPAKGQIRIDPTWQVGAGTDDVLRWLTPSGWSIAGNSVYAGAPDATNYQYGSGMRFTNITIPQGAAIGTGTYLALYAFENISGVVVRSRISAEDVDDAPTFADSAATFDARWAARTTARVDWDSIPAWGIGGTYNSPEIKTVIQEIVDRAGWVSGNDIATFWEDFEDRSSHVANAYRRASSYNGSAPNAPKLVIVYTVLPPTVTTQAVTAISGTTATGNGTIVSGGGDAVTQHGHCWNTTGTPTTADSKTTNGAASAGAFTSAMTVLVAGTKYYVRAYATNSGGTSYGNEVIFWANKGTIYPSEPLARVSNLIHRYDARQSINQLEISLGDITSVLSLPFMESAVRATADKQKAQDSTPIIDAAVDEATSKAVVALKNYWSRQIPPYSANVTALQPEPRPLTAKQLGMTQEELAKLANQPGIIELLRQLGER